MANELLRILLASVFASALMLLVRRPLRRYCGAGAAYAAWSIVPACMLAALLPHSAGGVQWAFSMPATPVALQAVQARANAAGLPWRAWLAAAWMAGACVLAVRFAWQQLQYQRGLRDGAGAGRVLRSGAADSGPVLLGLWRPLLVLPIDFRQNFGGAERRLVLAHERIHAERGDLWANAACALLQCLAWCNPLIHIAATRFRLDQELACDESVLRLHGQAATYARALLKTLLSVQGIPLACQWQAAHPLKERIVHLKSTASPARRRAGQFAAGLLLAASSLAAWAAQAGAPSDKHYLVTLNMLGSSPTVLVKAGEPAEIAMGQGSDQWRTRLVVTPHESQVQLRALVTHGGKQIDDYTVVGPLGQDMNIGSKEVPEFRAKLHVVEKTGG
jgi:beta-lactamase regulating signal transducer with metallopeptidase domain